MNVIPVDTNDPRYQPENCPVCGPSGPSFSCHDQFYSGRTFEVTMFCPGCQTKWQETYRLESVIVIID